MKASILRLLILGMLVFSAASCITPKAPDANSAPANAPAAQEDWLAYFGATFSDVEWTSDPAAAPMRLGPGVKEIVPGSPAGKCGLAVGDVIHEIDGVSVMKMSPAGLSDNIEHLRPGQEIELTVMRPVKVALPPYMTVSRPPWGGRKLKFRVRLGGMQPQTLPMVKGDGSGYLGAVLEDQWQRGDAPLIRGEGVSAREIYPGSPAFKAGLTYSDTIIKLNGVRIGRGSAADLSKEIARFKPGQEIVLTVLRSLDMTMWPAGVQPPDPPWGGEEVQIRVRLGTAPATLPTPPRYNPLEGMISQANAAANHFIVLPFDGASPPAAGETPLVYAIDEDRDLLSLFVCDGKKTEFMPGAWDLKRVFPDHDQKPAEDNVRVAASVTGSKYSAFIARIQGGGSALHLFDRHGRMAIFKFDFAARKLVLIDVRPLKEAFK